MCRPTTCRRCRQRTWAGCGQHVDQVMANVPRDQRCRCDASSTESKPPASSTDGRSFLQRLTGR